MKCNRRNEMHFSLISYYSIAFIAELHFRLFVFSHFSSFPLPLSLLLINRIVCSFPILLFLLFPSISISQCFLSVVLSYQFHFIFIDHSISANIKQIELIEMLSKQHERTRASFKCKSINIYEYASKICMNMICWIEITRRI